MFLENFLEDKEFLKLLENTTVKEHHVKIEVLDFNENVISEIQGKSTGGSISLDGASAMRRTCNITMNVTEDGYSLTNLDNLISINKKIRVFSGYTNPSNAHKKYGETLWFPLGVFVVITASISHNLTDANINITAKDKMCLLNGECAGQLPAPVALHEKYTRIDADTTKIEYVSIYDIIREAVIHLGGVDPSKVIINDIPLKIKKVYRYKGKSPIYFDEFGNEFKDSAAPGVVRTLNSGDLAGYDWVDFTYPGELIKQAGETVTSILDSIKNVLGNYEYFYDLDGNFVFQEMKNYLNKSYVPITDLEGDDYTVNFGESQNVYSFKESNITTSFNNTPNYQNIKNDFIVWGKRESTSGAELPIRYHVAIDEIPTVPSEFGNIPWQVYLYEYGKSASALATDPGYYYRELQNEIPKLYDFEKQKWKDIDSAAMDAYLDFISSDSELGKFSIGAIGRRTIAVTDDEVNTLYRPDTPDYIILEKSSEGLADKIKEFNSLGQKFIIVEDIKMYSYASIGKDAFSVVRDLVFQHTAYNESISITSLPIYYLEPNVRIEVEDKKSDIYGDYIIRNLSVPLTYDGTMSITATRATRRN